MNQNNDNTKLLEFLGVTLQKPRQAGSATLNDAIAEDGLLALLGHGEFSGISYELLRQMAAASPHKSKHPPIIRPFYYGVDSVENDTNLIPKATTVPAFFVDEITVIPLQLLTPVVEGITKVNGDWVLKPAGIEIINPENYQQYRHEKLTVIIDSMPQDLITPKIQKPPIINPYTLRVNLSPLPVL